MTADEDARTSAELCVPMRCDPGLSQRDREAERTSDVRLARQPNASAHQFDQRSGNGESQARAAKSPRRRAIGLLECFENKFLLSSREFQSRCR